MSFKPMKVGFWSMNSHHGPKPGELGRALQDRGFESVWFGEHSHIPLSSQHYANDPLMLIAYAHMFDPILSALEAATKAPNLNVGTAIALPLQHDLLSYAKQLATVDFLTAGRLHLGVGVGWNQPEFESHTNVPWRTRFAALEERVAALRAVWSAPEDGFQGVFDAFPPTMVEPRPVRASGVPVYAGVSGKLGLSHAARWADGWLPMDFGGNAQRRVERFRAEVAASGRDPEAVSITVLLMGDPPLERIELFRDLGVERIVLGGGVDYRESTWSQLDAWAAIL
jgi:probable F420-dependent oxidoreductase